MQRQKHLAEQGDAVIFPDTVVGTAGVRELVQRLHAAGRADRLIASVS
jgi:hypothetical protein